jgi:hypothetical protein
MSERWRRELGKIDELEPSAHVLDEARVLPPSTPTGPSGRSRVLAGVVAFVLFGAAVAFISGAFGGSSTVGDTDTSPSVSTAPSSTIQRAFDGWLVTATVEPREAGPLRITIGDFKNAPSGNAHTWLQHDFTLENTGNQTLQFEDWRTSVFLGPPARSLLVGDAGCGYAASSAAAPVEAGACITNLVSTVLQPGESVTRTISLWKELNGMPALTAGTYTFTRTLRYAVVGDPGSETDVPVTITYSIEQDPRGLETQTQSPGPTGGPTTDVDPLGWSIQLPPGWTASHHGFDVNEGATISGEVSGTPIDITIEHFTPGYVVTPAEMTYPQDDTPLPLDPKKLEPGEGGPSMWFMEGGMSFRIQVGSRLTLRPDAQSVVDDIIRSIAFVPWQQAPPGESQVRNGWRSLYGFDADPNAMQDAGVSWQCWSADVCYVAFYGTEMPLVLGPIPICGEGENMTADRSSGYPIVLQCPDGTTQAWSGSGDASPTNVGPYASVLAQHPMIRAWDGTSLTNTKLGNGPHG